VLVDAPPRDVIAQYGRTVLAMTLEQPPKDWTPICRSWEALEGVEDVQTRGAQAFVRLQERPKLEAAILDVLRTAGLEAAHYHHQRPNLSTAYFQLTGPTPATDEPPRNAGRGRRRR
jgi:hypothetical protein